MFSLLLLNDESTTTFRCMFFYNDIKLPYLKAEVINTNKGSRQLVHVFGYFSPLLCFSG